MAQMLFTDVLRHAGVRDYVCVCAWCVCVCVCVCVYTHTHMHPYIYIYIQNIYTYTCVCVRACVCVCVCVCVGGGQECHRSQGPAGYNERHGFRNQVCVSHDLLWCVIGLFSSYNRSLFLPIPWCVSRHLLVTLKDMGFETRHNFLFHFLFFAGFHERHGFRS